MTEKRYHPDSVMRFRQASTIAAPVIGLAAGQGGPGPRSGNNRKRYPRTESLPPPRGPCDEPASACPTHARPMLGQGRILFCLGENGYAKEFRLPSVVALLERYAAGSRQPWAPQSFRFRPPRLRKKSGSLALFATIQNGYALWSIGYSSANFPMFDLSGIA